MQPIHQKALADITWADLEALVAGAAAEGPNLEFKRTLADANGGDDPWIKGQDRIGRPARDELAREIVAFANAYGGLLLLGVDEEKRSGAAQALTPLPRCADLAERLQRAIGDIVDPPMPGFDVRAVPSPEGDGTGIVALRVAASSAAPHGYGEPPQSYVRRGTSATPMTMRDLQAVFWEARSKRERIDHIRARYREDMRSAYRDQLMLVQSPQNTVLADEAGLIVRMTAIAQQPLALTSEALANLVPRSRLAGSAFEDGWWMPFGGGQPLQSWRPRAHGLQGFDEGPSLWTALDDGTVSLIGFSPGLPMPNRMNMHFPGSFVLHAAQVLVMSDWLRREAGRPDIPIELDVELLHDGTAVGAEGTRITAAFTGHVNRSVEIGPLIFASRASAEAVFRELETQIWNGMGFRTPSRAQVDFARWFSPGRR